MVIIYALYVRSQDGILPLNCEQPYVQYGTCFKLGTYKIVSQLASPLNMSKLAMPATNLLPRSLVPSNGKSLHLSFSYQIILHHFTIRGFSVRTYINQDGCLLKESTLKIYLTTFGALSDSQYFQTKVLQVSQH